MSFTQGHVINLAFSHDLLSLPLPILHDKNGSFSIFLYSADGDAASANYSISKNNSSFMASLLSSVVGLYGEQIFLSIDETGVYAELSGDSIGVLDYCAKIIG